MDDTRDGRDGAGDERERAHPSIRLAPIDHDEYDALADLFLGDGGMAPGADLDAPAEDSEPDPEPAPHDTHTPVLHLTHSGEDAQLPKAGLEPAMGVIESLEETGQHASDLMAELLGDGGLGDDEPAVEFVRMPRARVELIVLGHLPVRATLWARQYACASAKSSGEVVSLIRAASGSTAIDLITGREPERVGGTSDIDGALGVIHSRADRVVVRVDERLEPELLDRPEVSAITILTGADEAAVVASYRLVKTIDATLSDRYEDMEDAPRLRIAVMGSSREQGEDARSKLRNAVESFLRRPVEIEIGSGRIDATGTTNIFRDTSSHHAGDIIDGLVALAHRAEIGSEPERGRPVEGMARSEPTPGSDPSPEIGVRPRAIEDFAPRKVDRPIKEAAPPGRPQTPPRDPREHPDQDPGLRDGLCAMLEGIAPIETRCPKAPGVEMGVDEDGRLQLIVCDADCDQALERLYGAQSWAREHLALLLRAEPGLRHPSADPREDASATLHLIAHEPAALRGLYDTPVRMYALARVRVGGVIAQVATPLN